MAGTGMALMLGACAGGESSTVNSEADQESSTADSEKAYGCKIAETGIKLHSPMIEYKDMDEAVRFWQDIMGFTLVARFVWPEEIAEPSDDLLQYEVACFDSGSGLCIECMKHLSPEQVELPYDQHGASDSATGIKELQLIVPDMEYCENLYQRVVDEGFEIIVDLGEFGFEFNDKEGNSIQICTYGSSEVYWFFLGGQLMGDTRTDEQIAYLKELYK